MKRFFKILLWTVAVVAVVFCTMLWVGNHSQNGPGTFKAVVYVESDKGKVIVINDEVSQTVGGGRGGNLHQNIYCWLIQLDAVTGKVLKRRETNWLDYFGMDGGNIWMISSDTNVQLHSMNPYSFEVVENYKSILAKAQARNPSFKDKIASWEADKYSGNILITAFDATKFAVNPVTFESHDCTDDRDEKNKVKGLGSVGIYEQDRGHYLAYTDNTCYELDGRESVQILRLDQYRFGPTDTPTALCEPAYVTKQHVLCEQRFVDGAFVYDAFTRKPLKFEGDSGTYLCHLDRLGKGGKNMLTHVDASGKITMQCDITQPDPTHVLQEAFVADGRLYLVFPQSVQARDASGKLLWEYVEDTMTNKTSS